MKLSELVGFFENRIEPYIFQRIVDDEVMQHQELLKITGVSAPVYLDGKDGFMIKPIHIDKILLALSTGAITSNTMKYIIEAIQMYDGFSFVNDNLEDIIFEIFDDATNETPSADEVVILRKRLRTINGRNNVPEKN